jgi:hypothetical protein
MPPFEIELNHLPFQTQLIDQLRAWNCDHRPPYPNPG